MSEKEKTKHQFLQELKELRAKVEMLKGAWKSGGDQSSEERERLMVIIEATTDFVGYASPDRRILYLNKAARQATGLTDEVDVSQMNVTDFHPQWTNRVLSEEAFPCAIRDGIWSGEGAWLSRDGREIASWMVVHAHKTPTGEVEFFSTISRDITKRKVVEQKLRETQIYLDSILSSIPAGVAILRGPDFRYSHINQTLAEINGLPIADHLGKPLAQVLPDAAPDLLPRLQAVMKTGKPALNHEFSTHLPKNPRQVRHFIDSFIPIQDADGIPVAVSAVVIDITEQMLVAEALREKTNQLAAVTESMTAFLESGDWRKASSFILRCALGQTESEYGFVGVVAEGPVLRILSHEGIKWDEIINREFYENALRTYKKLGYIEFTNFDNLFGKVITTGKTVLSNDPGRNPHSGGIPPGHPALKHFLGVPIFGKAGVVGMIAVANRPGGYAGGEEDKIGILTRSAGVLYDSYQRQQREDQLKVERQEAEEELERHRQHLEELVQVRTEELSKTNKELNREIEERKRAEKGLEDKNIALKELLGQIELEKKAIKDNVLTNVDHLLMPVLKKMRRRNSSFDEKQVLLIERNLKELTATFGNQLTRKLYNLSPTEIEICNMIKGGLRTKDMAQLLHISPLTVETHRNKIRKKLGLTTKKTNLTSYLNSL